MDEPAPGIARVQIGRVKLKGGADLHIIRRPAGRTESGDQLRSWTSAVLMHERHPDAVACVAFIWSAEQKRYARSVLWWSDHPAFPNAALPDMARSSLLGAIIEDNTESKIMHNLGYRPVDPPDGAA